MTKLLSSRDYETLSAYLDGELSEREKAKLETRLSQQPELRAGLEELRQTSLLLRSLPMTRAPRNFTIQPHMVGRRRSAPRAYPFLRLASALAAVLFVIVFAGDLALGQVPKSLPAAMNAPAAAAPTQAPQLKSSPLQTNRTVAGDQATTEAPAATSAPVISAPVAPPAEAPTEPAAAQPTPSTGAAASGLAETQTEPAVPEATIPPEENPAGSAPAPTEPKPEMFGLSVAPSETEPSSSGMGAGQPPTATPEPTQVPTATPMLSTEIVPPTVGPRTSIGVAATPGAQPSAADSSASSTGSAERSTTADQTGPAATESASVPAPAVEPYSSGPAAVATTNPNPPGVHPIQEYIRPFLHASEFFLGGIALLAGLAAVILKLTAR